jgi:hypothetical protein
MDTSDDQRLALVWQSVPDAIRISGGERYIPCRAAGRLLDACLSQGVAVIGIEALAAEKAGLVPLMDKIADYSSLLAPGRVWDEVVAESVGLARAFADSIPDPSYLLCFTLVPTAD